MSYKAHKYIRLVRLDKPAGFWLLLWPTVWALYYPTHKMPSLVIVGIFVIGTLMMRSAGCLINDWVDRDIDRHVERTRSRPLASGECNGLECAVILLLCLLVSACCALYLGWQMIIISIPTLALVALYPWVKRYFALPQLVLSVVFSMGVIFAFVVTEGSMRSHAWYMYLTSVIWVFAFDGVYALNDIDDDTKIGVKSFAIFFGSHAFYVLMVCYGMFYFLILAAAYKYASSLLFIYMFGLCFIAIYLTYHYYQLKLHWHSFVLNAWFGFLMSLYFVLLSIT